MWRTSRTALLCMIGLVLAISFVSGCGDDECPVCPPDQTIQATIDNIWPNADGNWWRYDYAWRTWEQDPITFANEIDVPPAPTLDEIAAIIGTHPIGPGVTTLNQRYQLLFAGLDTTLSGVRAQNLEGLIYDIPPERAPVRTAHGEDSYYMRIMAARPDLRDAIVPLLSEPAREIAAPLFAAGVPGIPLIYMDSGPLLIHDGIWWKTVDWIGTYGDVEQRLAWKFLESNLAPGHEFTYQLIPALASDVWLHCRVTRRINVDTSAGSFRDALELIYMIDYGVQESDVSSPPVVYWRVIDFGTVVYAPEYGPVYCYERNLAYVGSDTLAAGYGDRTLQLNDSNLLSD